MFLSPQRLPGSCISCKASPGLDMRGHPPSSPVRSQCHRFHNRPGCVCLRAVTLPFHPPGSPSLGKHRICFLAGLVCAQQSSMLHTLKCRKLSPTCHLILPVGDSSTNTYHHPTCQNIFIQLFVFLSSCLQNDSCLMTDFRCHVPCYISGTYNNARM